MNGVYIAYKLDSSGAERLIKDILPYLIIKKKQAKVLLELNSTMMVRGKCKKLPESIWCERQRLYEECKKLNKMIKQEVDL